jgi:hypothetical protein
VAWNVVCFAQWGMAQNYEHTNQFEMVFEKVKKWLNHSNHSGDGER